MKTVAALLAALAFLLVPTRGSSDEAKADPATQCWVCAKGSTCDECRFDGNDTPNRRKACVKLGCVLTDKTIACSTEKDRKVCNPPN